MLSHLGITHILTVLDEQCDYARQIPLSVPLCPTVRSRKRIVVLDNRKANLKVHFGDIIKYIRDALNSNPRAKVLVHCFSGISRSAAAVLVYLVSEKGISLVDACEQLTARRAITCPNIRFINDLFAFEKEIAARDGRVLQRVVESGIVEHCFWTDSSLFFCGIFYISNLLY